ncbi:MAG TPA: caspase family protein [Pyrinomonadaceae bacterium]|nr:caspase family protein [Pyrinomonadaceae bacterium]
MRISKSYKRFFRAGLFAVLGSVGVWLSFGGARMAERASAQVRPPMFVLQVGIGKYVNAPPLTGSVNDVNEMRKVLEGDRYGIAPTNIVTLTDSQGTKQKIFDAFQTHLIANARANYEKTGRKDAIVLFQFSGHGSQVPDVDGDEKDDGKDETLVTYDSRDAAGKNLDITDDEIYALTSELRRWTDNIVYIFDSCHSGSGTRDAEDVRRIPERKTVPVSIPGLAPPTRSGTMKVADDESGVLPPGDDYIVITAARSGELASQKNCFEECGDARRPVVFGNLTFYLVDELKNARADTSYRELMENVTRRVTAEKPTQTPQIEGDKSRFVFGSLGRTEDNFVRIIAAETKAPNGSRTVKIAAGAMQGVTPGTIVSFYDKTVTRFDKAEKIAQGTVAAVLPGESSVVLIDPKRQITTADKSVVVGPDLGAVRLRVNLAADTAKLTTVEKKILASLENSLTTRAGQDEARGIDVITPQFRAAGRWDVAVLKDKYSAVAQKIGGNVTCEYPGHPAGRRDEVKPGAGSEVFYLAGKDYIPLFRFCLSTDAAGEDEQLATSRRLEEALVHLSRLKSVGAIANRGSALSGKLVVKPVRLIGPFGCENGRFKFGSREALAANPKSGAFALSAGDVFWFEVTNNSPSDLYLAFLNLAPDGSVKLFSPRERDEEKNGVVVPKNGGKRILMSEDCRVDAEGNFLEAGPLRASPVTGVDRFKLIASVGRIAREDFEYLEMSSLAKRAGKGGMAGAGDWTAVETIFQINDTGN